MAAAQFEVHVVDGVHHGARAAAELEVLLEVDGLQHHVAARSALAGVDGRRPVRSGSEVMWFT